MLAEDVLLSMRNMIRLLPSKKLEQLFDELNQLSEFEKKRWGKLRDAAIDIAGQELWDRDEGATE